MRDFYKHECLDSFKIPPQLNGDNNINYILEMK